MKNILIECLDILNINIEELYIDQLLNYWNLLFEYNKSVNLISRKLSEKEGFITHIVDSLSPLLFTWPKQLSYMDFGSGGGLPGIPLKIVNPDWSTTLVEATGKKALFLEKAGHHLIFNNYCVINKFIETSSILNIPNFDLITTRGLTKLFSTIPMVDHLLRPNGNFLAFKGPQGNEELKQAQDNLKKYKFNLADCREFKLPKIEIDRKLFLFDKLE
jgi:16S rRNA (guanine527-N7)-methyltransferase